MRSSRRMYSGFRSTDSSPSRKALPAEHGTQGDFGFSQEPARTVVLKRPSQQHGLGFSIRGGRELGLGIYISKVEEGSGADKAGVKAGDEIKTVNGKSFDSISHQEAIRILKSFSTLRMTLCAVGRIPSTCILHQTYTWVDRNGRRVSPPDEYEPQFHRSSSTWSLYSIGQSSKVKKVMLSLEEGESLGLMIRGGTEYGLGIYITGVDPDSAADRGNLQIGDQILEVNDASFEDITHDEAVRILKHSKHIVMKVLDVGKIPFSCTMYDEMHWDVPGAEEDVQSCISTDDELQSTHYAMTDPESLRMFNEKAKLVLSRQDESTLNYYRTEYEKGQMTLDAFVAVLLEILNTTDKFSLLSEIRELLPQADQVKYDDLIYSRELEIKKACQQLGSSLEHLVADHKADKARRSSADCYRYTPVFSSGPDSRRKSSSIYDSPRRAMSASSQGLYWGGEDAYGDDLRTPSEDSGVDLANGCHYGSRDFQWQARRPDRHSFSLGAAPRDRRDAEARREHWARRRHSSGGEGSLERSSHRRPANDPHATGPSRKTRSGSNPAPAERRWSIPNDQPPEGAASSSLRLQPRMTAQAHRHRTKGAPQQPTPPQPSQPTPPARARKKAQFLPSTPLRPTVVTSRDLLQVGRDLIFLHLHVGATSAHLLLLQLGLNRADSAADRRRSIDPISAGIQEPEGLRSSAAPATGYRAQEQGLAGDRDRGWSRHPPPAASYHQHPPARGSVPSQWPEGRPRHPGRGWSEPERSLPPNRGQPHHRGVHRSLPQRNGADRRQNEETHSGDEALVHHANQRRQTMIHENDVRTAAALVSPRRSLQHPLQPTASQQAKSRHS